MERASRNSGQAVLEQQSFEPGSPGPILADIQTLIEAIGTGIPTTSQYYALPIRELPSLNSQMTKPVIHKLKRPQLKSFPTLAGLFLLLRASGLAVGESKPKRILTIDPAMYEAWASLNSTEKYMSMLTVALTTADLTILGEWDPYGVTLGSDIRTLYYQIQHKGACDANDLSSMAYGYTKRVALALLEQFGWVEAERGTKADPGKVAEIQSVKRTDFGDAMYETLGGILPSYDREEESSIADIVKPLLPQWQHSLHLIEPPFRDGRYSLKVSWSDVWRRIEAPATASLEDIYGCILTAFKFDDDHLFEFSYRDRRGVALRVADSRHGEGELFADEVRLGDLPLDEDESLKMLYDFGNSWGFTITLESVDESNVRDCKPKITARHGKPPQQYARWEY